MSGDPEIEIAKDNDNERLPGESLADYLRRQNTAGKSSPMHPEPSEKQSASVEQNPKPPGLKWRPKTPPGLKPRIT